MRLDTDKARAAGNEVLEAADALRSVKVPEALRSAAQRLQGLGVADALGESAEGYGDYVKRFADELDWLGHAVISAADVIDATDEDAKAAIEHVGIPA